MTRCTAQGSEVNVRWMLFILLWSGAYILAFFMVRVLEMSNILCLMLLV